MMLPTTEKLPKPCQEVEYCGREIKSRPYRRNNLQFGSGGADLQFRCASHQATAAKMIDLMADIRIGNFTRRLALRRNDELGELAMGRSDERRPDQFGRSSAALRLASRLLGHGNRRHCQRTSSD